MCSRKGEYSKSVGLQDIMTTFPAPPHHPVSSPFASFPSSGPPHPTPSLPFKVTKGWAEMTGCELSRNANSDEIRVNKQCKATREGHNRENKTKQRVILWENET